MASSPKLTPLLLILSLLLIQIHARESHFFSKVPNNNGETQIPDKVVDPLTNPQKTTTPQDKQPDFIPQTQDNGYGLYGHESGQLPPNSESKFSDRPFTTYDDEDNNYRRNDAVSYKSESGDGYNNYNNNFNNNDNFQNGNSKPYENSFYYNKDLYDNGRQSFQNTRLSRDDYRTTPLYDQEKYDDKYNNFYYNNNNNGGDNANNVVRQGMSDTRFMENGKYFYDLNSEPHHYSSSRGYFGNNNNNNGNPYEYGNSMGKYQNDDAEFQEQPDEFVP